MRFVAGGRSTAAGSREQAHKVLTVGAWGRGRLPASVPLERLHHAGPLENVLWQREALHRLDQGPERVGVRARGDDQSHHRSVL